MLDSLVLDVFSRNIFTFSWDIFIHCPNADRITKPRGCVDICTNQKLYGRHRCLLCLCLTEPGGLVKLGRSLHEQAGVYYLEESRRILSLHAERRSPPPELNARVSFKVHLTVNALLHEM